MRHHPSVAAALQRQFGLVTTEQLRAAGVPPRTMRRAVAQGELEVIVPGVLRSPAHPVTFESRAMAVQLHVGCGGALSGPTAARLYGLHRMADDRIWVRVAARGRSALPSWVRRTESAWMLADDQCVRVTRGWRLLAPVAMLVTLAERFNDFRFERAAEDAWNLDLLTPDEVAAFLDAHRRHGRNGVRRIERWLARTAPRSRPTQSGFEMDVLAALRGAGLPEPRRQHAVLLASGETIHLDFAWPDVLLAIEPGHSRWHAGRLKVGADYARDRACAELGWLVLRYDESARADLDALGSEVAAAHTRRRALLPP